MSAVVRAKFQCAGKRPVDLNRERTDVRLEAVTCGSPENDEFFKWTPSGIVELGGLRHGAADQFEVGKQYYVDFTPAAQPAGDK